MPKEETRQQTLEQIFAAAIKESAEQKLVISPKAVAQVSQNSEISMHLDSNGNFVLVVRDSE